MSADVFAPQRDLEGPFSIIRPDQSRLLSRLLSEHRQYQEDAAKWRAHIGRKFPIMDGPSIPWAAIEPFEAVAQQNHTQSLERLAERGGLSVVEALAIMLEIRIYGPSWDALVAKPLPENIARLRTLAPPTPNGATNG